MGNGMDQGTARRRARELGGIATMARKGTTGKWITGGWATKKDVWIVLSIDHQVVLDEGDGPTPGDEPAKEAQP
jgi:hypothetical protein